MTTHQGREVPNSCLRILRRFSLQYFLRQACDLGIVPVFQSLKMYTVSFYHELALGWRQEEGGEEEEKEEEEEEEEEELWRL
jgi:hypothetical protein